MIIYNLGHSVTPCDSLTVKAVDILFSKKNALMGRFRNRKKYRGQK